MALRAAAAASALAALLIAFSGCIGAARPNADPTVVSNLPDKILVLPLEDKSGSNDPELAAHMTELLAAQLRLVSLSTLGPRDAAALAKEMQAPMPSGSDAAALRRFCEVTGCEAVVVGTIAAYQKGKAWSDDRLALSVRLVNPVTGRTIRGTTFVSDGPHQDESVRGLDQLSLYGVQTVTRELARAR